MKTAEILNFATPNDGLTIPYIYIYVYVTNSNTKEVILYECVGNKDIKIGKYTLTKTSSNIGYIKTDNTTGYDIKNIYYKIKECIKGKATPKSKMKNIYFSDTSQGIGGRYHTNFIYDKNAISTLITRKSIVKKVITWDIIANLKGVNCFTDFLPAKGTQKYVPIDIFKIHGKFDFAPVLDIEEKTDPDTGETTIIDWNDTIRDYLAEHADEF